MKEGELKELVLKCLQDKSSKRPSASKLVTELEKMKDESELLRASTSGSHVTPVFTVLFLGNRNVGKSTLIETLKNPEYDIDKAPKLKATVEPNSLDHCFHHDGKVVKMGIIDTAGEEKYFCPTASYYRHVDGVFLVYDVSNKVSLRRLPFWIKSLSKYNSKDDLKMLLVGNKVDLRQTTDAEDLVPQEKAVKYASKIRSPYVETSARDADSVTAMYEKMVEILMSTVSPEDVDVQVRERRGSTIRLPSSAKKNNSKTNKCSC